MARIAGVSRSRTLIARLAFFLSRRSYGRVITPTQVYALDSGLLLAVGLMEEVQEWAKQTSAPVKQLARMLVAWRVGCPWCLDFGTKTSEKLGVTDEHLRALPDYEHSSLFSKEERAVLRYADAMTRTPVRVPDALFEARKRVLYRPTNPGDHGGYCLGEFPRAGEPCSRSGSRGVAGQVYLVPEEEHPPQNTSEVQ
jgi:AhpD family alkylhydroperoxidase